MLCMSQQPVGIDPEWTLGDRLGKALDFAGMSVGEMADYLECSRNTVSNYTNDHTKVPGAVLTLWAMRTGVRDEWLRTGGTSKPEPPEGGFRDELAALTEAKRGRTKRRPNTARYVLDVA